MTVIPVFQIYPKMPSIALQKNTNQDNTSENVIQEAIAKKVVLQDCNANSGEKSITCNTDGVKSIIFHTKTFSANKA